MVGWQGMARREDQATRSRVKLEARQRALAFEEKLRQVEDGLHSLHSFFVSSDSVSAAQFRTFVTPHLASHPEIQGIGYDPVVLSEGRRAFVARTREDRPNYEIRERQQGGLAVAGERQVYYPVLYVEPLAGNEAAVGFDIGSEPNRLAALNHSLKARTFAATAPITLVQEQGQEFGFLGILAVYGADPTAPASGLVVGVYRTSTLAKASLAALEPKIMNFQLFDVSPEGAVGLLEDAPSPAAVGYDQASELAFGGRTYRLVFRPTESFVDSLGSGYPLATLVVGSGFSALAALFLAFSIRRARRVEELVALSTAELAQRQQAEASLRLSEERLSLTLNAVSDGGWDWDLAEDHVAFSPAWLEALGYEEGELPPKMSSWEALLHPDDLEAVRQARQAHLAGETPLYECESRLRTKEGRYRPTLGRAKVVLRGPSGEALRMVGTDTDISRRKEAEAEQAVLQGRVQQTQKLESLGVVVGGIAHDFNNLLAGILGSAQIARRITEGTAPIQEHLQRIELASTRAAELTREMLAYAGRGTFAKGEVDLSELAAELPQLISASLSKKAQLEKELPEGIWVVADSTQVRQVVMNLLINASDALEGQTGRIVLRTGFAELSSSELADATLGEGREPGRFAFVEVEDTGVGLPEEIREKVFDPFFSTKASGRGLGLAAVIGIVRWHKGVIQIDSDPGKGTRVRALFPVLEGTPQSAKREVACAEPRALEPLTGTALVADDEANVRQIMVAALEMLGLTCLEVEDGQRGLEVFEAHADEITLGVFDMTMPNKSGVELAEAIREVKPNLPIVIVSGYAQPEDLVSIPGARFVSKPFRLPTLMDAVRAALGDR